MSDEEKDTLLEAFAALREETDGESESAAETRRAVLLKATTKRRRKLIIARFVLPLAAVFALSTAWAAATGRLPKKITELFVSEHEREPRWVPVPVTTRELPPAPVATTVLTVEKPPIEDTPFTPPPAVSSAVVKPAPPKPSASVASALDPEERLYKVAHEAHFVTRDWNAALGAWDAYLAAHPKGRFAPEARYNRGLTLIRLGRKDEAKAALAPFADGTMGGYRQREARELLDAMP